MRKGSSKAKITDKDRINWMEKWGWKLQRPAFGDGITPFNFWKLRVAIQYEPKKARIVRAPTIRSAIDAAIRASKPRPARGKAERGK